jgi:hypothetical protein
VAVDQLGNVVPAGAVALAACDVKNVELALKIPKVIAPPRGMSLLYSLVHKSPLPVELW